MTSSYQHTDNTERLDADFRGYLLEPFGPIGIISHSANEDFSRQINDVLYQKRLKRKEDSSNPYVSSAGYLRSDYLIQSQIVRFETGEGKVTLDQTVRGHDIFIISDILSHHAMFPVFGVDHKTSPDDHYRDLLRIIMAVSGKARRINVIMPFLYEGRQDHRQARESLDCAAMLQQLYQLGVANLIIFDPHDARIANAVPLMGIEMPKSAYKTISSLIASNPNLKINKDSMMVISPDETAISRSIFYSSLMGVPLGIFYRHKDYSVVVDGIHPVKEIRLLSDPIEGRDVLIVDDMINSGRTMVDTATIIKKEGARDVYCIAPFGLFTNGIDLIQDAVNKGIIKQVLCTNLIYRRPELLSAPWYVDVNMTPFVARLIDAINVDESLSGLINPSDMISDLLNQMRIGELFDY